MQEENKAGWAAGFDWNCQVACRQPFLSWTRSCCVALGLFHTCGLVVKQALNRAQQPMAINPRISNSTDQNRLNFGWLCRIRTAKRVTPGVGFFVPWFAFAS